MKKDSMNRPIYVNKKIEALLNSVGSLGYNRHHTGKWILSDINIEKFAQLIVRECVRMFADNGYDESVDMLIEHCNIDPRTFRS